MGVQHHGAHPLEVVETVLEVADVAWNAYEHHRRHSRAHPPSDDKAGEEGVDDDDDAELSCLRSENRRLRGLLEENLALLQGISESPSFSKDCPPDLYLRLVASVDSSNFLGQLKTLNEESTVADGFPFQKVTGEDSKTVDIMVNVSNGEPSLWVWVTKEMVSATVEEPSEIDNENYVIVSDENVVDGIANFMARCVLANPKSKGLTPEELQKILAKALDDTKSWWKLREVWHAGKIMYSLSTWGLALAGLYRHRGVVKAAARGIGATGKLVLKAV